MHGEIVEFARIEATTEASRIASLSTSELLFANAPIKRSWENALANTPAEKPQSFLNHGFDLVTSRVFSDQDTRKTVNHLGCEFVKTAALFAKGNVGIYGALLAFGLDQASPDTKPWEMASDFALGAAKGGTLKLGFSAIGSNFNFAPSKGIAMGIAARTADVVFDRQSLANPGRLYARLQTEVANPQALLFDAAIFSLGEGAFQFANWRSGGALAQNELRAGMVMGGTFGVINGGTGEIVRQISAGETLDLKKVAVKAGLEGGVGALGAGFGIKISDPAFHRRIAGGLINLKVNAFGDSQMREFVVVKGQNGLEQVINDRSLQTEATVREVSRLFGVERLGPEQRLVVQHTPDQAAKARAVVLPEKVDLVATCNAEKLPLSLRGKHVFPGLKGDLMMEVGPQANRLRFSATDPRVRGITLMGRPTYLDRGITINVMAPLLIGDPVNQSSSISQKEWSNFERQLAEAKRLGVDAISTDVWWGMIEPKPGQFNWSYYDKIAATIQKHGLKWTPILSFHQCGGNIGDNVNVPVPEWVWSKLASEMPGGRADAAKFVSEQGNASKEYVSFWATDKALKYYGNVMQAFQQRYAPYARNIAEINVSLGPSGEIRYPSYNSHDTGSGYPTRGALQANSELARESFRNYVMNKYGSMEGVEKAWGGKVQNIEPPRDTQGFLDRKMHHETQYGKDFFDWYNQSLVNHGRMVMSKALEVFASPNSAFQGIDIGAKIPGVHWRVGERNGNNVVVGDRLAELAAGLIRTTADWNADYGGHGYGPIMSMFRELQGTRSRVVPHFTALEMRDGADGPHARALPFTLATWVGREAVMQGLPIKGENALSFTLASPQAWDTMHSHLRLPGQNGYYSGLTFLRLSDVLQYPVAQAKIVDMIRAANATTAK